MGWRNLPYWLKGGLIFLVIGTLQIIWFLTYDWSKLMQDTSAPLYLMPIIILIPIVDELGAFSYPIVLISHFILGSVIGLFISKLKKNKY